MLSFTAARGTRACLPPTHDRSRPPVPGRAPASTACGGGPGARGSVRALFPSVVGLRVRIGVCVHDAVHGHVVCARVPRWMLAMALLAWLAPTMAYGRGGGSAPAASVGRDYQIADAQYPGVLYGGPAPGMAKASGDTFYLYGGPGRWPGQPDFKPEGKFETALGYPDRQGWTGVDLTGLPPHWHVDSFNAANMTAAPAYWSGPYAVPGTNHAIWSGLPAGPAGFPTTGYGNFWDEQLDRTFTVSNIADSTVITWDFQFNHDSERNYDFFNVQCDLAGSMVDLARYTGTNNVGGVFVAPVIFHGVTTYHAGDYVGVGHDQVHLRCRFVSDGAASDQDGLNATSDGAVQLDNIQVQGTNGVGLSQATFENGDAGGWVAVPGEFAGDFSKVFGHLGDIDPCRHDFSPQMTFIDDGTPPNNDPLGRSTGGSHSPYNSYGVPGGWVVNYTGGLTTGTKPLNNEVWSPAIAWDLPGPQDDAAEGGAFFRFTTWVHQPALNGLFWVWHVRSRPEPVSGGWSGWKDRNFAYLESGPGHYENDQVDVRGLLVTSPDSVQLALGVQDLADLFNFPGNDATPSPYFDNVAFAKYDAVGPGLVTREIDLFNDGFPTSGAISCAGADDTPLAIRLDMARDIRASSQPRNVPGDSITCDFVARKPGSSLDANSLRMEFLLEANPCFDPELAGGIAALQAGAGAGASDIQNIYGSVWRGYVKGKQSRTASGALFANRYFFDLPDGPLTLAAYEHAEPGLFFPGDQMRYYLIGSTINPAETSVLPADTSGFSSGSGYNRIFTVYGLPSLTCGATDTDPCRQPNILFWNDQPDRAGSDEWIQVFGQNGLRLHQEYDTYRTNGPTSLVSDGLGSAGAHGATSGQLAGYRCLFYDSANVASGLISDGSSTGSNDKGNDVATLTGWLAQAGTRYAAYWGDNIANGLGGGGVTYRSNVMGVQLVGDNVRASIGNQTAPEVAPTGTVPGFATHFIAFGGCSSINLFDNINPRVATARKAHEFLPGPYAPSASVYNARQDTIAGTPYDRVNVTFPYGFMFVQDVLPKAGGRTARSDLLRELLIKFGQGGLLDSDIVAADPIASRELIVSQNHPNPFNPATNIELTAPARGKLTVRIYNVRGELVATLVDGVIELGKHVLVWRGTDARGREVGSGVYLCKVTGFGQERSMKMALLR
jgi:hypothetical protein